MKRWAFRICVLLLLGAIVNVAVAWGCVWLSWPRHDAVSRPSFPFSWPGESTLLTDHCGSLRTFGWTPRSPDVDYDYPIESTTKRSIGYAFTSISEEQRARGRRARAMADFAGYPYAIVFISNAGWPALAVRGEHWVDYRAQPVMQFSYHGAYPRYPSVSEYLLSIHREVLVGPSRLPMDQQIPLRPIWPGFAINTVFYAVILWVLYAAPFALRRRRRIKRGLCPACAYPVGDSTVCTECGKPIPLSLVREGTGVREPAE